MGPKTARVDATIRGWLADGTLPPGGKLPSERTLVEQLAIGRTALRQVLARLLAEGLLEVRGRSSYIVPEPATAHPATSSPLATGGDTAGLLESTGTVSTVNPQGLPGWKTHGRRTVYDNPWITVDLVNVEPPGVDRFEHHLVRLHHVAIAAVLDDQDRVLMLWRYRFAADKWGWELPGGIVDSGENSRTAALREVEEETGWRPAGLEHVVTYEPMIGMVQSPHDVFVGRGAEHVGEPTDVEEAGHVQWVPLADVPVLMARGDLMGSGTLVALLHMLANRPA
ncbi:NUDIX domain-containing protein [Streptomyces sp. NPDC056652]|uniref:NUDIX domain-containing protein n=1 Tax=Streptomyces sp. NPDC056652 TaxID=3345893 RepID=UPI0036A60514